MALVAALTAGAALTGTAQAAPATAAPGARAPALDSPATAPGPVPEVTAVSPRDRTAVLGKGWQRSTDTAWTTTGDADGFHVLTAAAAEGFRWRTLATLAEPGVDPDAWVGNACVTGSGRRAVVVYAPRTFTNRAALAGRGGFTAVVDLVSGAVRKLPVRTSLAYFNPSCGAGEEAVLTQEGDEDLHRTRLLRLDAATGTVRTRIEVPGQLTSAVPTPSGIVAADAGALVQVSDSGVRRALASVAGVPFKLAADPGGGVVFLERSGADRVAVKRLAAAGVRTAATRRAVSAIAAGPLSGLDVTTPRGGRVYVTGAAASAAAQPGAVPVTRLPAGSRLSMDGSLALLSVTAARPDPGAEDPSGPRQVRITGKSLATGRTMEFAVTPAPSTGVRSSAAGQHAAGARPRALAGDPNSPADFDQRYCSVPRNDPGNQAMQPKPRQVEWAIDQAVRGALTVGRPANWKNLGMPAYTPQGLFPPLALDGGGAIPAQVMLGVAAQESNLWQAARFAVPGVTANPLIGNYYGVDIYNGNPADDWDIHWGNADCGYGVTQVTDGMRLAGHEKPGEHAMAYQTQRAVALDFAANVAAGVRMLESKWNEVRAAGMRVNNGDPSKIENWFYAVWAYNSGFHPAGSGPWGVGWGNNPVNPRYPANRPPFMRQYADATHPQDWPYPEKVMGWAGHPVEVLEAPDKLVAGYRSAWWNGDVVTGPKNRDEVQPPPTLFCDASNDCHPGEKHTPDAPDVIGEPAGPCAHRDGAGRYDLRCWYHQSATWKSDCDYSCGNELLRFDPGYAYQDDGTAYPPRCDLTGLPAGALIVDDVPNNTPVVRPGCPQTWTNSGTFTFSYGKDALGQYPGKVDTHQLGAGFGGHFWFTHTRTANDNGGKLAVTGTWRLDRARNGPMKILVALPDHGAQTAAATYVVKTARGERTRVIHQYGSGNRWASLGTFLFNGVPEVRLSSVTPNGEGKDDIAYDAMAFVPMNGTYHEESVEADAVFDENQNIDTAFPESWLAGNLADRKALYDWATGITGRILDLPPCQPEMVGDCLLPRTKLMVSAWRDQIVSAGTDPVNHPAGNSLARWIGFANSALDRPTTDQRPPSFDDDARYKIRLKATVSFLTGDDGMVLAGSEYAIYEHRTANTHLPRFFLDLVQAIREDYGISAPDLGYRLADLNHHDGEWTSVDPLSNGGFLPGRAYATAGKAPVPVDGANNPSTDKAVCVAALVTAGGSIGYRPMLSASGPPKGMSAWIDRLKNSKLVSKPVIALASDIRDMFFDDGILPGATASVFAAAPPIWQELNFKACADGSIQRIPTPANQMVLRSSWMPSQYLYHNDRAIDLTGAYSGSSQPVVTGDFKKFSRSGLLTADTGYGVCNSVTGRSGSPWDIAPLDSAGTDPSAAHFCLDATLKPDPEFSG